MSLSGVDLNLLVALDALLGERNVTRAAERTSVGQPAMSASLSRLRKHFDDPLLIRQGRGLVLTPLAESLVGPVHSAVEAAEAVLGPRTAFEPTTAHRTFTLMASDYVALVLLRPLFNLLATQAPAVRVNVVSLQVDYVEQLRRGQVDLLIAPTAAVGQQPLPYRRLFTETFLLACDADNTDVGDTVTAEEFSKLPYLSYGIGPLQMLAEDELEELGVNRQVEVRTQTFLVVPFLLTGTRFVSLLHARLANQVLDQARLRVLPPPVRLSPIVEAMYWHARHTDNPAHQWLRRQIAMLASTV